MTTSASDWSRSDLSSAQEDDREFRQSADAAPTAFGGLLKCGPRPGHVSIEVFLYSLVTTSSRSNVFRESFFTAAWCGP